MIPLCGSSSAGGDPESRRSSSASRRRVTSIGAVDTEMELLSDDTAQLFNELEASCAGDGVALSLARRARAAANEELKLALAALQAGYTSSYRAGLRTKQGLAETEEAVGALSAHSQASAAIMAAAPSSTTQALALPMPASWRSATKAAVGAEYQWQQASARTTVSSARLTLREAASATVAFFAEALAASLYCEVVRVYLYDERDNLHCTATFPYRCHAADPMKTTLTELMLVKELHRTVCRTGLAVHAMEDRDEGLTRREAAEVAAEMEEEGLGSLRSCLIFPIPTSGPGRPAHGMIHAANKVSARADEAGAFTPADEAMLTVASRLLGAILSRYPAGLFTLNVGEALRRAAYPGDDPLACTHLPVELSDSVTGAVEVGNAALMATSMTPIVRAPLMEVYQSRAYQASQRRHGTMRLTPEVASISSVEETIDAVGKLWSAGMEDNTEMHKRYTDLAGRMGNARLLLQNVLDGLAITRTMRDPREMARYLQRLEVLGRAENVDRLAEFTRTVLIDRTAAPKTPREPGSEEEGDGCGGGGVVVVGAPAVSRGVFLTDSDAKELARHHQCINKMTVRRIHPEGPEGIRTYSSNPPAKRAEVRFIEELQQRGRNKQSSPPPAIGPAAASGRGRGTVGQPCLSDTAASTQRTGPKAATAASRRPFLLSPRDAK